FELLAHVLAHLPLDSLALISAGVLDDFRFTGDEDGAVGVTRDFVDDVTQMLVVARQYDQIVAVLGGVLADHGVGMTEEYFGRDRLFPRSRQLTRLAQGRFKLFAAGALRVTHFINRACDLGNGNDADDPHLSALAPRQLDRIIERRARFG